MRETADLVDHYFLVEATITHKGENKPILWERLRCVGCLKDPPIIISLHCRFTERFSFLREDQVIHVVVDQLGDDEVHRSKAEGSGTDWWVFLLFGHFSDVSCFTFAGGLSSNRPRLV